MSEPKEKFDRENYPNDQRVISYVKKDVKTQLKDAVDSGLCKSVSKLSADIIEKNATKHIEKLKK